MAVLRVNAQGTTPVLHGIAAPLRASLETALAAEGPIVIMLHGYKFRPNDPKHCPHSHIFALKDVRDGKVISWPAHLGMTAPEAKDGLAIAFGWDARGTVWQARDSAKQASVALATVVCMIRRAAPCKPVHIFAHSMGGYVALKAIKQLSPYDIGRAVLMNAAVYRRQALEALASPAGQSCEFFNITSQENAFFDAAFEYLFRPEHSGDRVLGPNLHADNAISLDLSRPEVLGYFAELGLDIAPRTHSVCHWSTYLRAGVFDLYQALFRQPELTALAAMHHRLSVPQLPAHQAMMHSALPERFGQV